MTGQRDATNAIDLLRRIAVEYERTGEALTRSDAEGEILRGVISNGWATGHMLRIPPRTGLYSCAPTRAGLRFLGGVDGQPYWWRERGARVLELGPLRIEVTETTMRDGDGERPAWIVSVPGIGDDLDRQGAADVEEAKRRGVELAAEWLRDAGPRLAASLRGAS